MKFNRSVSVAKTCLLIIFLIVLLSGCLYREAVQKEGSAAYREGVQRVQLAVDQYQSDHDILPLITPSEDTPKYEKYRVDLSLLQKQGYLESIPQAAFENGGSVYFLIQNEEADPVIKVMDLITVQYVNDIEKLVAKYRDRHDGALPVSQEDAVLPDGLHPLDLQLAGGQKYALTSVYSGQNLGYLVDEEGRVYVDYAPDLMQVVEKTGYTPGPSSDFREMLTEQSYFVPVKSLPYFWQDERPVPQPE